MEKSKNLVVFFQRTLRRSISEENYAKVLELVGELDKQLLHLNNLEKALEEKRRAQLKLKASTQRSRGC